jgi:predicted dinucleotide-binding enzyme
MDVTIIGTGNMGRAIATRLLAGGHSVTLLGTEAAKAEAVAQELEGSIRTGAVGDPVAGDVVILAVWYPTTNEVLDLYGDQLDGKVVVDISNPIDVDAFEPLVLDAGSSAQEAAGRTPRARIVKAFNTTFAGTLSEGRVGGQPLDVFIASDDDDAKETVAKLVEDGGLRAVDAGPLRRARELEAAGFLHMTVQNPLGTGFGSALKVIA